MRFLTLIFLLALTRPVSVTAGSLAGLSWLSGHWVDSNETVTTEEVWLHPAGGMMVGMNRSIPRPDAPFFEFLLIREVGGNPVYFARPGGSEPVAFHLKSTGEKCVLFLNLKHDFPQSVRYWLDRYGTMHVRISGVVDGALRSSSWRWVRKQHRP